MIMLERAVSFLILSSFLVTETNGAAAFVAPSRSRVASIKAFTSTTSLFATSGRMNARIIGVGSAVPKTVLTNKDLESMVETSDEWIQSRTGISKRHVLQFSEDFGDNGSAATGTADIVKPESLRALSVEASKKALEMANIEAKDLDMVICATSTAEDMFGDATTVAAALGCTSNTVAFDVSAACSGFLFGTITAGKFLSSGPQKQRALVIGADSLSRWIDWNDRNVCILFGDGAGAIVVESCPKEESGILGFSAHSNGNGYGDLNCGFNGNKVELPAKENLSVSSGSYSKLVMNGKEVYKFATREVPDALEKAMAAADITVDGLDWLLLHQANIRIMEVVAKRFGIPMEKVITNLSEYGNTSSASIPLALDEAVRKGQVKPGDTIAVAGFGAGLSWGGAIIKWK